MSTNSYMTRLEGNTTVEKVVEIIRRDGGVIVADFLSGDLLAKLRAELDQVLNETSPGIDPHFSGTATRRASRLLARCEHASDVALNPLFLGAAKAILETPIPVWVGSDRVEVSPNIQLGVTQAIQIGPGETAQPLHRDDATCLWRHPDFGREARLQIMIAITDFTSENGGTMVIPGSHKWDDERMPTVDEAIPTEMKAGSALLWLGSTYHGGGENRTNTARIGFTMAYDVGFVRSEENHFLSLPLEKVRSLPEELQELIGWRCSETLQGWVEIGGQMHDPKVLLKNPEFKEVGKDF